MSTSSNLIWAALAIGAVTGMRSMLAPTLVSRALSERDDLAGAGEAAQLLTSDTAQTFLPVLAASEMIGDKMPFAPDRTIVPSMMFRALSGGASAAALAGGGNPPCPGEISLAHHGVLFLDELPEWNRSALETLREPLESGHIRIARAARSVQYPARFQLVAAMNPCPCGWAGDRSNRCLCSDERINRYRARVSGPLLDRIDLHISVARMDAVELRESTPLGEPSAAVRARVEAAHAKQQVRGGLNAHLPPAALRACTRLSEADQDMLEQAIERLQLSARAMHRILRVARTIADLAGCEGIQTAHLAEAIGYRQLDRGKPGV